MATRTTTVKVQPAVPAEVPKEVEIFEFTKEVIDVTLVGLSDLIVNNPSEKTIQAIEDERRLDAEQKLAKKRQPREPVIPEEKFHAARILDAAGRDCVFARWVKACLVTAATRFGQDCGIPGTQVRGALFVLGDYLPIEFEGVKAKGHKGQLPVMRRDMVKVGKFPNKQLDLRYRPAYPKWKLHIQIEFEPKLISVGGLHHLIRRAGSSIGLCEWRPEKSPAGIYGRFDLQRDA